MSSLLIHITPAVFGASLVIALVRYHKFLSPEAKARSFMFYKRQIWGVLGVVGPMILSIILSRAPKSDLISFLWLCALFVMIWPGMLGWLMGRGLKTQAPGPAPIPPGQENAATGDSKPPTLG